MATMSAEHSVAAMATAATEQPAVATVATMTAEQTAATVAAAEQTTVAAAAAAATIASRGLIVTADQGNADQGNEQGQTKHESTIHPQLLQQNRYLGTLLKRCLPSKKSLTPGDGYGGGTPLSQWPQLLQSRFPEKRCGYLPAYRGIAATSKRGVALRRQQRLGREPVVRAAQPSRPALPTSGG
jgi:hypothetical protein